MHICSSLSGPFGFFPYWSICLRLVSCEDYLHTAGTVWHQSQSFSSHLASFYILFYFRSSLSQTGCSKSVYVFLERVKGQVGRKSLGDTCL